MRCSQNRLVPFEGFQCYMLVDKLKLILEINMIPIQALSKMYLFATLLFYPQLAHSLTLPLPLSSPQIVTACIVTSQLPSFEGRLSKIKQILTTVCCVCMLTMLNDQYRS